MAGQPRRVAELRGGRDGSAPGPAGRARHQRGHRLDAHQRHPQHAELRADARREGRPLGDGRPGRLQLAHPVGADRRRPAEHAHQDLPDGGARRPIYPGQLLHGLRPGPLRGELRQPAVGAGAEAPLLPQTAAVERLRRLSVAGGRPRRGPGAGPPRSGGPPAARAACGGPGDGPRRPGVTP